ncbi:uncharacterized protein B0P05DRAFT_529712 [Gilbertella persicaria]|uniref:uncharacterized protein n=1 Tax=Gilbertella persicaria TaxID=101096 RepID=UPI00221EBCFA|nr:uncharacterized protein B0P05DRAFT_529712 [Gilbertella persicaria]KAI8090193.1 hypothetical protein B0P05DRAFT_529712 [Gilbertella persicaria]
MSEQSLSTINHHSQTITKKKTSKTTHVPTACINCKKAHLACDLSRPCKRCSTLGKSDTCIDIKHKKRGRPKLNAIKKHTPTPSQPPKQTSFVSVQAPALLPLNTSIHSSFKMTSFREQKREENRLPPEMMTMFLSMDLCCARASDESVKFFHMDPTTLGHRSLYDLIHPDSSETLSRLHRILLDNCHHHVTQPISFTPASSDAFLTTSPAQLLSIANGSQTLVESLRFKSSTFECKFYMGGGLGGDLFKPCSLNQLYIVCLISYSPHSYPDIIDTILNKDPILDSNFMLNNNMDLVNQLYEVIMSPSSSSSSVTEHSPKYHSDDEEKMVPQEQGFSCLLDDFLHSPEHQKLNAAPIGDLVHDFLNDNPTYWLG